MTGYIIFDPLIPWELLALVAVVAVIGVALAAMRGLSGWALRGLAALVILGALSGPSIGQAMNYAAMERVDAGKATLWLLGIVLVAGLADDHAADGRPRFVAGSMGPGTRLPSLGHTTFADLAADKAFLDDAAAFPTPVDHIKLEDLTADDVGCLITDSFGESVAISGDTVIVGAYGNDEFRGSAHVFRRDHGGADAAGEAKGHVTGGGARYDAATSAWPSASAQSSAVWWSSTSSTSGDWPTGRAYGRSARALRCRKARQSSSKASIAPDREGTSSSS